MDKAMIAKHLAIAERHVTGGSGILIVNGKSFVNCSAMVAILHWQCHC
jgi:hypothetical protein